MKKAIYKTVITGLAICLLLSAITCDSINDDYTSQKVKEVKVSYYSTYQTDAQTEYYVDEDGTYHIDKIFVSNPIG